MDTAYELGGLTGFIAILLIALGYGGWRTGWFSRQEGARTDDATLKFNVVVNRAVDGREVHTPGLMILRAGSDSLGAGPYTRFIASMSSLSLAVIALGGILLAWHHY